MQGNYTYKFYKKFLAVLMTALLLLLTSMNFFQFPPSDPDNELVSMENSTSNSEDFPEENEPSPNGPDEKAPGNPVSISEEYLHDHNEENSSVSDNLIHQLLLVCSKVHPPHTELITPPPDLFS